MMSHKIFIIKDILHGSMALLVKQILQYIVDDWKQRTMKVHRTS